MTKTDTGRSGIMSEAIELSGAILADLSVRIGYEFIDTKLLAAALTHASVLSRGRNAPESYDRLEFLGDRVLGLALCERLYERFSDAPAGELSGRLSALAREETLADVAREIGLGDLIVMSMGEEKTGGRDRPGILSDVVEALIAAIYLDGGFGNASAFVDRYWSDLIDQVEPPKRDPKTRLQEYSQSRGFSTPVYEDVRREGPDHDPSFRVSAVVDGLGAAEGVGGNKRAAQRAAALALLEQSGGGDAP